MRAIAVLLLLSMGSIASADVIGGVGFNISGVIFTITSGSPPAPWRQVAQR